MNGAVQVSKILVYPIKGLDPVEVKEAKLTPKGSLEHDREFWFIDGEGGVVSGKREKRLHRVRSSFNLKLGTLSISYEGKSYEFSLENTPEIEGFFSDILGYRVFLKRDPSGGLPDDRKAHGPTFVSKETIKEVAGWFALEEDNVRRRFRSNIEISGVPPFWEDALVGRRFRVGSALFEGRGISKRCPVPTRDPYSGEVYKNFVSIFSERRGGSLPPWSQRELFSDTFYRLCLNTSLLEGESIKVGDELSSQD